VQQPPSAQQREAGEVEATERRGGIAKAPTGIVGLDLITGGGLPRGRTSLVCGSAGSGKTLFAIEFLVRGALEHGEPGLFMAFEETAEELTANVASLGFDLDELIACGLLRVDDVRLEPGELRDGGAYDLDGLFIRLGHAIDMIGAKRVALDTIEVLFGSLPGEANLRYELGRLFRWLKDRGVTAVVTGERSGGGLTRHGLEEFVSDCVIVLDHRVEAQASVRRLRIVKYRGSGHGADEYPFLIERDGFSVVPLSAVGLEYTVTDERVSSGIDDLDAMLGGEGVYRGSAVLLSGTAGTGKTSIAASFAAAACRRGERCVFFSFEESSGQIVRDLGSIGLDLQRWVDEDLLRFHSARPTAHGLEMHLSRMHRIIDEFDPSVVVVDPITAFDAIAEPREIAATVTRLMDVCRSRGVTSIFTSLSAGGAPLEATAANISSVADVWMLVRDIESSGERNRALYVLKARGMAHSNQVREFVLRDDGIVLLPVHVGPDGVMTGSERANHEARERLEHLAREHEVERARLELDLQRKRHLAAVAALEAEFAAEESRTRKLIDHARATAELRDEGVRLQVRRRSGRAGGRASGRSEEDAS
jgi:circadian clock protein KaiC